jgi:hypothetical protein
LIPKSLTTPSIHPDSFGSAKVEVFSTLPNFSKHFFSENYTALQPAQLHLKDLLLHHFLKADGKDNGRRIPANFICNKTLLRHRKPLLILRLSERKILIDAIHPAYNDKSWMRKLVITIATI